MDKRGDLKEAFVALARESLIKISSYLPEKYQNADVVEDGVVADESDKYRAELISISYSESPEIALSPKVALGRPRY